jgi:hypothetical protein
MFVCFIRTVLQPSFFILPLYGQKDDSTPLIYWNGWRYSLDPPTTCATLPRNTSILTRVDSLTLATTMKTRIYNRNGPTRAFVDARATRTA